MRLAADLDATGGAVRSSLAERAPWRGVTPWEPVYRPAYEVAAGPDDIAALDALTDPDGMHYALRRLDLYLADTATVYVRRA